LPPKSVDAYDFLAKLSSVLAPDELIYVDTGGNLTWTCNGLRPKEGQAVFSAWNNTPMGYALPAAMGGASFDKSRPVTCLIGDGGLCLCLGELANLAAYRFPVKVFLFNNHGHAIQKQTLETWLGGNYVGVDPSSGLAFPDFPAVARAMNLPVYTIDNPSSMAADLQKIHAQPGPVFVNVEINPNQRLYPFVKFGAALDNQSPPLEAAPCLALTPNRKSP
jgi:acetolactate synthase-1/2/3 large subunit